MVRTWQVCAPLAVVISLVIANFAHAATRTWDGGTGVGDGSNWTTPANWAADIAPIAGADDLIFAGTNDAATNNDFVVDSIFNGITFDATAGAFTLAGNRVQLPAPLDAGGGLSTGGSIIQNATTTQTISLPLLLAPGRHTITTAASAGAVNLSGAVQRNTGGLLVVNKGAGSGNINLAVSTGLANDGSDAGGILGGWAIIGNDWATLDGGNNVVAYTGYTDVATGGAIASSATSNVRSAINTATPANITMAAAGTTDINTYLYSNANTGNSTQTVDVGTGNVLRFGARGGIYSTSNTGSGQNRQLTFGVAATPGTITAGGAVDTAGELTIYSNPFNAGGGNNLTINSVIADNGTGVVSVNVSGYIAFSTSANTYTGGTIISQGRVQAGNAASFGTGGVTVLPGGQAFLNTNGPWANNFTISGVGTTEAAGNGAIRTNNGRTINGNVTLAGTASVTSNSGANTANTFSTFTGNFDGPGGLIIGSGNNNTGSGIVRFGNGTGTQTYTYQGDTTINGATFVSTAANGVSANTMFIVTGSNGLLPSGANRGNFIVTGNTGNTGLLDLNSTTQTINGLSSSGSGQANAIVATDPAAAAATLTLGNNNASGNYAGTISGPLNIEKTGTGTQTFSGVNYGTGTLTINQGTVRINGPTSVASAATTATTVGTNQAVIAVASAAGVVVGQPVSGAGIPANTFVQSISGTNVRLNKLIPAAITASPVTFGAGSPNGTGAVTVNSGGTLAGSGTVNGSVTVNTGGALSGGSTLTLSGATVDMNAGTLLNVSPNVSPSQASIDVTTASALRLNGGAGSVTVNVGGIVTAGNQYELVDYNTGFGAGDFSAFTLGTQPNRTTGSLVDNAGNTSVDYLVTSVDRPRWSGAGNGVWSTAVQAPKNWVLNSDGTTPTDYLEGDNPLFDDSATGTTTVAVSGADVAPAAVEFNNNTKTYTIDGPNSINSPGALTKSNGGTAILNTAATFGGVATINAGILQIGNGGTTGSLSAASITNNSTLDFNRSDSVTFGTAINGATGTVRHNGSGTTTLSAASSFGGGLSVNNGAVRLTSATGAGTGAITVNTGGTLVYGAVATNAVTLAGGTIGPVAAQMNPTTAVLTAAAATTSTIRMADPQNLPVTLGTDALEVNITSDLQGSGNITVLSNGQDVNPDGGNGFRLRGTGAATFSGVLTIGNNVKSEIQTTVAGPYSPAGTGKIRLSAGDANLNNTVTTLTPTGGYSTLNLRNNFTGNTVFGNDVEIIGTGMAVLNPLGSALAGSTITMGNLKIGAGQEAVVYLGAEPNHPVVFTSVTLTGGNATFSPKKEFYNNANPANPSSDLVLGDINETAASSITIGGLRTLYLQGAGGYTGTTTVSSGTLQVGGIAAGGTAGGALGAGNVINNATLAFNRSNAYAVSNAISGTGAVQQKGSSVLTLSGTNSYAGTTSVSAGTLLVTGTHTGAGKYGVSSGATLGGNGSIGFGNVASTIDVDSGATVAPGASIGQLTLDGSGTSAAVLAMASGSILSYELGSTNQSDTIKLTNAAAADVTFINTAINFTDTTAGALTPGNYTLFTADAAGAYGGAGYVVDGSNKITGGLTIGTGLAAYNAATTLRQVGSDILLNLVVLPGDYNANGSVDSADYVVWRENDGTSNNMLNDATPGTVDSTDYDLWRANFGNSFPGSGGSTNVPNVPEPTSVMLALLVAGAVALVGRRRPRGSK